MFERSIGSLKEIVLRSTGTLSATSCEELYAMCKDMLEIDKTFNSHALQYLSKYKRKSSNKKVSHKIDKQFNTHVLSE